MINNREFTKKNISKQAILITAYKNYNHLEEIINFFDDNFEIYIHIDKKSKISNIEFENLKKYTNVILLSQKFKVNWGGFNHLKSILYLINEALKNPNIYYFHLISGHDFPIKKKSDFIEFFNNNDKEYIDYFNMPKIGYADNGNMDRIEYYNLFDLFNSKINKQKSLINIFIKIQKRLGIKRSIPSKMPKLYGGSTWWSLTRECIKYVSDYTKKNKSLLYRFKYTLCSEEIYFQTIIMNSNFVSKVTNDNLRYIDWEYRNGNNPANLDYTDYEKIFKTGAFFARKFEYPLSSEIVKSIKHSIAE